MDNSKYQIWIKQWSTALRLPVLPPDIKINLDQSNEGIKLDRIGETTVIQPSSPAVVKFSSQFPSMWFPACEYKDFLQPVEFLKRLENMKRTGTVRFIITNTIVNWEMTIEKLEIEEKAEDNGTLYYTLELKAFREPTVKQVVVKNGVATVPSIAGKARPDSKVQQSTYTVKEGDFLLKIAKEQLGNSSMWADILALNTNLLNNNPYNLNIGMVLKMPQKKGQVSGRA